MLGFCQVRPKKSWANIATAKKFLNKHMISFKERVLAVVRKIPRGQTLTYKQVAIRADQPRAYRAVGNILHNYDPAVCGKIPCHRVVRSDGKIGGYRWGAKKKISLLKLEAKN